ATRRCVGRAAMPPSVGFSVASSAPRRKRWREGGGWTGGNALGAFRLLLGSSRRVEARRPAWARNAAAPKRHVRTASIRRCPDARSCVWNCGLEAVAHPDRERLEPAAGIAVRTAVGHATSAVVGGRIECGLGGRIVAIGGDPVA